MASFNVSLLDKLRSVEDIPSWCKTNQLSYIKGTSIFGIKYEERNKNYQEDWNLETRGPYFSSDCKYIIRGMVPRTIEAQILRKMVPNTLKQMILVILGIQKIAI